MSILNTLRELETNNTSSDLMTDICFISAKAIQAKNETTTAIGSFLVEDWLMFYGVHERFLTENSSLSDKKWTFSAVCVTLGLRFMTVGTYTS